MAKFKNLKNFLVALSHEEITLDNIISNSVHHKTKGYTALNKLITPELKQSIIDTMVDSIGGRNTEVIKRNIDYGYVKTAGILSRVIMAYSNRDSKIRTSYCTGQDYSGEIRFLRKYLSK